MLIVLEQLLHINYEILLEVNILNQFQQDLHFGPNKSWQCVMVL